MSMRGRPQAVVRFIKQFQGSVIRRNGMRKKYWRRFNTILLLVAFSAPWLHSCGVNTLNGFQSTALFGIAISQFLSDPEPLNGDQSGVFVPIIFIGLICILLYSLMNLIYSFGFITKMFSGLKVSILTASGLGMVGSLAWAKWSGTNLEDFLWGYWLTWMGLLSSLGIEIMEDRVGSSRISVE
jgi:hypothetical protein